MPNISDVSESACDELEVAAVRPLNDLCITWYVQFLPFVANALSIYLFYSFS
jgi:hypothetical protein